jgi:hypothetical protein
MIHRFAAPTLSSRTKQLLLAVAGAAAISLAMAAGPASTAHAAWTNTFCVNAWLQPYGQSGDRCWMGVGYANHYSSFSVTAWERTGCVAVAGYFGEQITSWVCTSSAPGQVFTGVPNPPAGFYRGLIRNNNTRNPGSFSGGAYCNPEICV